MSRAAKTSAHSSVGFSGNICSTVKFFEFNSGSVPPACTSSFAKILAKLEVQAGGTEPELNSKNLTVEHILPENPTEEWAEVFAARDMVPYIGRIGNLTLLEAGKNKEAERKLYEDKLPIYKTSWFRITQRLMEVCWSPKSINERQKELAKQAAAAWRVNY